MPWQPALPILELRMSGLRFEPMIVYAALAFAGVIVLARVLLGWALRD